MRTLTSKNEKKRLALESLQMQPNEVFLGNIIVRDLQKTLTKFESLKTLRIGTQAYDITGLPLNRARYRPLFLDKAEIALHDNIMSNKRY